MTSENAEAFPLTWPMGRARTTEDARERSRFKTTIDRARKELMRELERLKATDIILSTNLPLRRDGAPHAGAANMRIVREDPGVAVYFKLKGRPMVFACDRWDRIEDNMQAINHTIEAIRGIDRWGSGDMLERAFTGFQALPAPIAAEAHWTTVLGVDESEDLDVIEATFRDKMKACHPDVGGSDALAAELNRAIAEARRAKGAS